MAARVSSQPSRLSRLTPGLARLLIGVSFALIAVGLIQRPASPPAGAANGGDPALYRAIVTRVANGQNYYAAAAAEQRARDYPLRPFTAVRPPLLARTVAAIGPARADLLLMLLALATAAATTLRFLRLLATPVREVAILLAVLSAGALGMPGLWVWHEIWAGLLIALALACRSDRVWLPSVALGLIAALLRELAIPFPLLMAIFAWREQRRHEAAAWAVAFVAGVMALLAHGLAAGAVATAADGASPGWLMLGGWWFDLALARQTSLLIFAPAWVAAIAVPLAAIGWLAWPGAYGRRVAAMLGVWMGPFLIIGRPDNLYWGFLFAPLLPLGLALAPRAIIDLVRAAAAPLPLPFRRFPAKA